MYTPAKNKSSIRHGPSGSTLCSTTVTLVKTKKLKFPSVKKVKPTSYPRNFFSSSKQILKRNKMCQYTRLSSPIHGLSLSAWAWTSQVVRVFIFRGVIISCCCCIYRKYIEAIVATYIEKEEPQVRLVAVQYASSVFPNDNVATRWVQFLPNMQNSCLSSMTIMCGSKLIKFWSGNNGVLLLNQIRTQGFVQKIYFYFSELKTEKLRNKQNFVNQIF